jgi:hypothetical protein
MDSHLESVATLQYGDKAVVQQMGIISPVIIITVTADSVEKPRTLFHAAIEGVISARRVLSNKLSDGKYQSNALSCTVDFAGQSFSTQSADFGLL